MKKVAFSEFSGLESEGLDAVFAPDVETRAFVAAEFDQDGEDSDLLVRKSTKEFWALGPDGKSVVRLFDCNGQPVKASSAFSRRVASVCRESLLGGSL